jgi:PEP-CTERM motif
MYRNVIARRSAAAVFALIVASVSTMAEAGTVYQSAAYTGADTGEYILSSDDLIGASFTLTKTTKITAIGAQFGGFPSGQIFGAIVPVSASTLLPTFSSSDIATSSLAHVVFSVPTATAIDLAEPLSVTLSAGTYGVVFGSGAFGANGSAGLGYQNDTVGSPKLFRSFFSSDWSSFDDTGVRLFVEGEAVSAVPEPATWAMMLIGFAGLGAVTRYRRRFSKIA